MDNTTYNAIQGYLAGKMGLLKLLEQKAEATENPSEIGRYFELENTLFELKNLISELKRFREQEGQETQEQATEQPHEELEGDEHLTLLEFCRKHGIELYRNKKSFTDSSDGTFDVGAIFTFNNGQYYCMSNGCMSNGKHVDMPSFLDELAKGNMIELYNPNT